MPNDADHKIRVVSEAFMGWKPGLCCPGGPPIMPGEVYKRCAHGRAKGHEVPPPNLLEPAGAWALLVALPQHADKLFTNRRLAESSRVMETLHAWLADIPHENDLEALLDAAYQLATKEQR